MFKKTPLRAPSNPKQTVIGLTASSSEKKSSLQLKIRNSKLSRNLKDDEQPANKPPRLSAKPAVSSVVRQPIVPVIRPKEQRSTAYLSKSLYRLEANAEKSEIGIQTNEREILNVEGLFIGDSHILLPSSRVLVAIERVRKQKADDERRALLQQKRTFEKHSEKQEIHLTNLNEFLTKGVITQVPQKAVQPANLDKPTTVPMNVNGISPSNLLGKTEPFSEINGRFRKKEEELLTLFDSI